MYFLYYKSLREFSYMRLTKCISLEKKAKKYPKSKHFTCDVLEFSAIIYQFANCKRACINLLYFTCVCFKKVLWIDKNTLIQASIHLSCFVFVLCFTFYLCTNPVPRYVYMYLTLERKVPSDCEYALNKACSFFYYLF